MSRWRCGGEKEETRWDFYMEARDRGELSTADTNAMYVPVEVQKDTLIHTFKLERIA